ncbi:hypothetical protein D3C86_2115790 [compost metagenome]
MLGPGAALALGERGQPGTVARQLRLTLENASVEAGQQDVFDQPFDPAHVTVKQAQLSQAR